jgi:transcriptional regulator with XRE-family HTH domain
MVDGAHEALSANPVGDRLRSAREAKGLSLDDVAAMTRVPTRHLEHIDNGEWDSLPAITYSLGFARAYAKMVGLNPSEIGTQLRAQLGSAPISSAATSYYEPADPARVPPKSLALVAALIALLLVAGYFIWRNNALGEGDPLAEAAAVDTPIVAPSGAPGGPAAPGQRGRAATAGPAGGPVVLTATDEVWLRVYDGKGGPALFQNSLKPGERFEIPASAARPMIRTGRPNALRVTVGSREIPPLGPPERLVADVSLLPADLVARAQAPQPGPAPAQPAR